MKNVTFGKLQILSVYNTNENKTYNNIYFIGINRIRDLDYIYTLYIKLLYGIKST